MPFGAPTIRAVKQERKHYHIDWSLPTSEAVRFENMVACHLLKWVQFKQDTEGLDWELRYFRDVDRREVDFIVTNKSTPFLMVECKLNDRDVDRSLVYLKNKFPDADAWQISLNGSRDL